MINAKPIEDHKYRFAVGLVSVMYNGSIMSLLGSRLPVTLIMAL